MNVRIYIPVWFLLIISGNGFAQVNDSSEALFSVGARFHRSFIIQHSEKLSREITSSYPWMGEVDLNWHLRKRSIWDYCLCYPRTGISFVYTNFDRPVILGEAWSAYFFIEPFIRTGRRLNYSIRFGMGPSYVTRIYDVETNPDNIFFSTPVSFLVLLNASANYRLSPRLTLRVAGNYNHISNGGYSKPNMGMNFPSFNAGIDYSFSDIELPDRDPLPGRINQSKKNRIDISAGFSAKPTSQGFSENRYPIYVLNANYSRTAGKLIALTGGLEWVNDRSVFRGLRETGTKNENGDYPDHNRAGVLLGIDWLFGRFIFYQQMGIYVYSPAKVQSVVYQRYGLNFRISQNIFAGVNIKAHGQNADFTDIRIGYSF